MPARPARRRSAYAALALGLAGSLALTGCHSGSSKSRKSSSSGSSRSKKRKIIGGAAAGVGAGAARRRGTINCSPHTSRLDFAQQTGPKGYVTVRYTNRSGTLNCRLYGGPLLSFDGAKSPLPMLRAGRGNGVRLRPGATAYAVVPTNTPAALGTRQKTVSVRFAGSSQGSTTGSPVTYDLVAKHTTLSVGQGKVSFWNSTLSSARTEAGVGS
ncbi:DUF4232 domain-containing protein [Streptomyces sp. NPDC090442]|uniref:DUF4232 domain-containing protein n=1 Tax=Streptomyces sp. NPDC090442 TaxID=3365962 RepID=UPI0037F71BB8